MVLPAVHILDGIYAARVTIEALKQRYGMENRLWPESVVESLRDRHNQIFKQIEEHIGALPANLYYPLGEAVLFRRLAARPAHLTDGQMIVGALPAHLYLPAGEAALPAGLSSGLTSWSAPWLHQPAPLPWWGGALIAEGIK